MNMDNQMKKVRVYYKNPIKNKSAIMFMRDSIILFYKGDGKSFSPYKTINKIKRL